jgi:hypothetical protein
MSREIEDRLRAAFESKTAQVTASSLRAADLPQDDDRPSDGVLLPFGGRRHRWIAPMLAAAAVVAVVAGATAAVRIGAEGHHRSSANTVTGIPSPSVSSSPGARPSTHHKSQAAPPGGGSSNSSDSSGSGSSGPPVPTHADVLGVHVVGPAHRADPGSRWRLLLRRLGRRSVQHRLPMLHGRPDPRSVLRAAEHDGAA